MEYVVSAANQANLIKKAAKLARDLFAAGFTEAAMSVMTEIAAMVQDSPRLQRLLPASFVSALDVLAPGAVLLLTGSVAKVLPRFAIQALTTGSETTPSTVQNLSLANSQRLSSRRLQAEGLKLLGAGRAEGIRFLGVSSRFGGPAVPFKMLEPMVSALPVSSTWKPSTTAAQALAIAAEEFRSARAWEPAARLGAVAPAIAFGTERPESTFRVWRDLHMRTGLNPSSTEAMRLGEVLLEKGYPAEATQIQFDAARQQDRDWRGMWSAVEPAVAAVRQEIEDEFKPARLIASPLLRTVAASTTPPKSSEGPSRFYFILEGAKIKQDQVVSASDFDLVFSYDNPPEDAVANVSGAKLEAQRKACKGALDVVINLRTPNLELRDEGRPYGRAEFKEGKLIEPVRFQLRAVSPGEAQIQVNFQVRGASVYRMVLDLRVVNSIDAAVPLKKPLDIDLDELSGNERTPRDVKLLISDAGGTWRVSRYSAQEWGDPTTLSTDFTPSQLHTTLRDTIKPLLETVAKSAVWKSIGRDLSMDGEPVPGELMGNLLTAGWLLYKVLSQTKFSEHLKKLESLPSGAKISIETQTAFIPWEILYPLEYNESWPADHPLKIRNYQPEKLWGNRFQVEVLLMPEESERVPDPLQPGPTTVTMVVGKSVASTEPSSEAVEWQSDYFQRQLSGRGEYLTDRKKIQEIFLAQDYPATFIYLLCHGQASPDRLEFEKDFAVTPDEIVLEYPYPRRPLIFVNSCSVGAISPLAFTSFLRTFHLKKAAGLIASSFPLPTRFAAAFGQKLLDGYLENEPIGDVLFKLRRALYERQIPLGMFYSLQTPLDTRGRAVASTNA